MTATLMPLMIALVALVVLELLTDRAGADGRSIADDAADW